LKILSVHVVVNLLLRGTRKACFVYGIRKRICNKWGRWHTTWRFVVYIALLRHLAVFCSGREII